MLLKVLILFSPVLGFAAVYNCNQSSPKPSQFFERRLKIECDLDAEARPKFVVLSGSSKVELKRKAQYIGPDSGELYQMHQMTALDGQVFDIHTASALFTETAQASFFTVEPNNGSGFWVCRIEF
jgi:hypothetical protein